MRFCLQDPIFSSAYSLHEILLDMCEKAVYGVGVFAFVTREGVELFLGDKVFEDFMKGEEATFNLIVGIDEITNTNTLAKLQVMKNKYGEKLVLKVFMHTHKNTTFHPKFTWFKNVDGGTVIVGSNNLTMKGLRRNIEAFSINEVAEHEIKEIEQYFEQWIQENSEFLFDIDNEEVVKRAEENRRIVVRKKKDSATLDKINDEIEEEISETIESVNQGEEEMIDEEDFEAWTFMDNHQVLVAQIPDNNKRWSQANFSKASFETFFEVIAGQNGQYRILLRNINKNGKMDDIEIRPSVSVKSHNYRFELNAAKGMNYPSEGRPIGVFIKVSVRMYVYTLVMPDDSFYNEVDNYITPFKGKNMVRHITTVDDVRENCPSLPLWNITR